MRSLAEVVAYFNRGGDKQHGVTPASIVGFVGETTIEPLGLSTQEEADLVAFLEALTGPGPDPALLVP